MVQFSLDVSGMIRLAEQCGTHVEDEECTLHLCQTVGMEGPTCET